MNVTGKIVELELNAQIEKQAGGSYPGWKLVYKDNTGEYKTIAKHANSLKFNAALANGLKELSVGDDFTLELKKEGEFWNPVTIYKGIVVTSSAAPTVSTNKPTTQSAGSSGNNTFEVNNQLKEKQMKFDVERQPLIIRQTCLTAATNLATLFKLKTEEDVLAQAKRFIAFIETGDTGSVEDMSNDDIEVE